MTVGEFVFSVQLRSKLKVVSARTGKVLAQNFSRSRNGELSGLKITALSADIRLQDLEYGHQAVPFLCLAVEDGHDCPEVEDGSPAD